MGFSRQEYWNGLTCPLPGDLPNPGIKPGSPALQADSLPSESPKTLSSIFCLPSSSPAPFSIHICATGGWLLWTALTRFLCFGASGEFSSWETPADQRASGESVSGSVMFHPFWPHGLCSPPGSSERGIHQARILKWIAIPFPRGSSQPRDLSWVCCIAGRFFTVWATRKAPRGERVAFLLSPVSSLPNHSCQDCRLPPEAALPYSNTHWDQVTAVPPALFRVQG